jgi:hypothetical protein
MSHGYANSPHEVSIATALSIGVYTSIGSLIASLYAVRPGFPTPKVVSTGHYDYNVSLYLWGGNVSKNTWDMWPDETDRQYKAFECFLEIDPRVRTIENAWTKYTEITEDASGHQPSSSFHAWSRKFKWHDRAKAYDQHLATKRRNAREAGIVKEAKRQGVSIEKVREDLAHNFNTIQNTLQKLMGTLNPDEIDPDKITLAGISGMMRVQLQIAQYLSDDSHGKTPEEELDRMSEEELVKRLREGSARDGEEEGTP